jgi:hypothetical protein
MYPRTVRALRQALPGHVLSDRTLSGASIYLDVHYSLGKISIFDGDIRISEQLFASNAHTRAGEDQHFPSLIAALRLDVSLETMLMD